MIIVFAHDHTFYKNDDIFYSTGGFSREVIGRYTNVFEEVSILSRQKEMKQGDKGLTLASTDRVNFIKVPNFKSLKGFHKLCKAKKIIEKEVKRADCVIARLPSSIGSIAVNMAKKYKKAYLVEVVTCPWDSLWNHSTMGKMIAPFEYINMHQIVRNSDFVVYVTEKFLQSRYPTKGKSVCCSNVNLLEFDDQVLKRRKEKILKYSKDDKIKIGTIAAVNVKFKGQKYIMRALSLLKKKGINNFEYYLVGQGDQSYLKKEAIKYGVLNEVKFIGTLPHSQIFKWLDEIDIYVQPSRQEGLPRALIEAMSRGLPAFGADTGGIPELLEKEFIFSNSSHNIKEIINILKKFNRNTMKVQAMRNFNEAKNYDKELVEKNRKEFFRDFKNSIICEN